MVEENKTVWECGLGGGGGGGGDMYGKACHMCFTSLTWESE